MVHPAAPGRRDGKSGVTPKGCPTSLRVLQLDSSKENGEFSMGTGFILAEHLLPSSFGMVALGAKCFQFQDPIWKCSHPMHVSTGCLGGPTGCPNPTTGAEPRCSGIKAMMAPDFGVFLGLFKSLWGQSSPSVGELCPTTGVKAAKWLFRRKEEGFGVIVPPLGSAVLLPRPRATVADNSSNNSLSSFALLP